MVEYIKLRAKITYGGNRMNTKNSVSSEIAILNKDFAYNINLALLIIHMGLLLAFTLLQAHVMIFINILSIIVYMSTLRFVTTNVARFLKVTYLEILIHMISAAICMGWDCGFQLYCFVLLPLIYYSHSISRKTTKKRLSHKMLIYIDLLCFFVVRLYSIYFEPIYDIFDDTASVIIYIINSCVVFAFLIVFLSLYENMEHHIELYLKHTAEHDPLTGLANRRKMHEFFDSIDVSSEYSIALIDIDGFKKVNDTYGHNIGDDVLRMVANILAKSENKNIHACRWGGEEFLLLCTCDNSFDTLKILLEQIRVEVSDTAIPLTDSDTSLNITVSSGVALHKNNEKLITTLNRSDEYLYTAKNSGKNQVYTED